MAFTDYNQILTDAKALIATISTFEYVGRNTSDRDFAAPNMPLADVRIRRIVPELTSQQAYYVEIQLEVEIHALDLTSRDEAATIRETLISAVQDKFRLNPRFSAFSDATILGDVELATEENDDVGPVAAAIVRVSVFGYSN